MYITDIVNYDKKRSKVICEDETFLLYKGEIKRFGLTADLEISDELYYKISDEILYKRAKERSIHLIEAMDRTEYQIRQKLIEGYYPDKVIERVIAFLIKYGLIDDEQYTKKYVEMNISKKSIKAIALDLKIKGIPRDIAEKILIKDVEKEKVQIIKLLEKKHYNCNSDDIKEKRRIVDFLLRRGYDYELINSSMKEYKNEYY